MQLAAQAYGPNVALLLKHIELIGQGVWVYKVDSVEAVNWRTT